MGMSRKGVHLILMAYLVREGEVRKKKVSVLSLSLSKTQNRRD
jgi:hypothetical protein